MEKQGFQGLETNLPPNKEICQANSDDREAQFQIGLSYLRKQHYEAAERWFRYAAAQGHPKANQRLSTGIREGYFKSVSQHINSLAIEVLEKFVTPSPSQPQIEEIEEIVTYHLNAEYGLMKPHTKKE